MSRGAVIYLWIATLAIAALWWIPKQTETSSLPVSNSEPLPGKTRNETAAELVVTETEIRKEKTPTAFKTEEIKLPTGSSVYNILVKAGLQPKHVLDLIDAAKPIRNLASVAARTLIKFSWIDKADQYPRRISFKLSNTEALVVEHKREEDRWNANLEKAIVTTEIRRFSGLVNSTLWDSAEKAGMDAAMINNLAAVFAWQVDFSRGVQPNDRWRLTVEQRFANGKPIGWGNILAAEYENTGVLVSAVRYVREGVKGEYFQPDGNSLKRMFLKSPLRFGRITSRFNRSRFHPILKRRRPHLGVDYGASRGTPVMAVGNGIVEYVGRRGGSGNTVKIRHNSVYQTAYKHLHKYGRGIKPGKEVKMGDVIGTVGSTGLATGPHLHFEMYENGAYVDPLGIKFPSADPVPKSHKEEFLVSAQQSLNLLPPWAEATIVEKTIRIAKGVTDGELLREPVVDPADSGASQQNPPEEPLQAEDELADPPLDPVVSMH